MTRKIHYIRQFTKQIWGAACMENCYGRAYGTTERDKVTCQNCRKTVYFARGEQDHVVEVNKLI